MLILHHGRNNGFVLLRALIGCAILLSVLVTSLVAFGTAVKRAGKVLREAERIIAARNNAEEYELEMR